jgi:hypothetical protein
VEGKRDILRGIACAALLLTLWRAGIARAQLVGGFVDLTYNHSVSRSSDVLAGSSKASSDAFLQRYSMNYNAMLYPYLRLKFGYMYERLMGETDFTSDITSSHSESTTTKLNPSVDLGLANPLFTAGLAFRRTELRQTGSETLFSDAYNASFALRRREGRPSLDIVATRYYNYDADRLRQDMVADTVSASTRYVPIKDLELRYQIAYNQSEDRLDDFESSGLGNSLRASYGTEFFDRRVTMNTNYSASASRSEASFSDTSATGSFLFPVAAGQGISGEGPFGSIGTGMQPTYERMVYKPLLVDTDTAIETDINIGFNPLNQRQRSMGLVFPKAEEMNLLYIYVKQDLDAVIADSFLWTVYVSSDPAPIEGGPKQWTQVQASLPAVYNAFYRRFEITFPLVQTQFIKVVTSPYPSSTSPVVGFDTTTIQVTEIQSVREVALSGAAGQKQIQRSFSQLYDLSVRTRIAEKPALVYHDFFYSIMDSADGESRYSMANTLTASRRFSTVFSGTLRGSRDDSNERQGHRTVHSVSASLTATPLPVLSHSLVLNWQGQTVASERSSSRSAYLSNAATLYQGIDLILSGGTSASSSSTGIETRNKLLNFGATIVPHQAVSMNLSHSDSISQQYGRGVGELTTRQTTNGGGVTWSPYPALYLAGSVAATSGRGTERSTVQNYSVSWAPFSGGNLQISMFYSETIETPGKQKTVSMGPTVRWRVNQRLITNASYSKSKTDSPLTTSKSDNFNGNVVWTF